jgi:hypothetical protein
LTERLCRGMSQSCSPIDLRALLSAYHTPQEQREASRGLMRSVMVMVTVTGLVKMGVAFCGSNGRRSTWSEGHFTPCITAVLHRYPLPQHRLGDGVWSYYIFISYLSAFTCDVHWTVALLRLHSLLSFLYKSCSISGQ